LLGNIDLTNLRLLIANKVLHKIFLLIPGELQHDELAVATDNENGNGVKGEIQDIQQQLPDVVNAGISDIPLDRLRENGKLIYLYGKCNVFWSIEVAQEFERIFKRIRRMEYLFC